MNGETEKMYAIINPIIVPMSSCIETQIPEQISRPFKEATRRNTYQIPEDCHE